MKSSPFFTFPDFNNPKYKRVLLACIALAAYIAWTLGAWEAFLIETGLRPKLRPTVLLAGDSLTEKGTNPKSNGWVTLLQHDYARSANVVPRGLSGYNTRWYLKYAMPVIRGEISRGTYNPVLITLWLGANDAALANGSNSEQHVPIENYRQNLIKIVREFQALAVDARIILITPPYVDDLARHRRAMKNDGDKHGIVDRTNEMTRSYAQVCVETAHKLGLPVVDLFSYFNDMPRWRRNNLLEDGLHLNTRGNKLMYNQLLDKIKDEFPDVVRKLERWQLPNFNKLVESDPWIPDEGISESTNSTQVQEERDIGSVITSAISSVKGKVTTASGKLTDAAKATKLWKTLTNPEKAMAAFQVTDDEIAQVRTLVKKANAEVGVANDNLAAYASGLAALKKDAKMSDDQIFAIAKILANSAKVEKVAKASDDKVRKVSEMLKVAAGRTARYTDDEIAKLAKEAQKAAGLADKQLAKATKMFATNFFAR